MISAAFQLLILQLPCELGSLCPAAAIPACSCAPGLQEETHGPFHHFLQKHCKERRTGLWSVRPFEISSCGFCLLLLHFLWAPKAARAVLPSWADPCCWSTQYQWDFFLVNALGFGSGPGGTWESANERAAPKLCDLVAKHKQWIMKVVVSQQFNSLKLVGINSASDDFS